MTTSAVVQFSGGAGSWAAARRAVECFGADAVTLLFADTSMEDEDLYRFVDEAVEQLGCRLVRIADGRTPWEVFADKRMLGNARVDPCSRILKRELLRAWIDEHYDPWETLVVLGVDWTEIHRHERAAPRWAPFHLWSPMTERPLLDKDEVLEAMRAVGLEPPRLYALGFAHNNCGGFCVKAGQAQFARLLEMMPERYAFHEAQEEALRARLGRDVSVMVDRRGLRPGEPRRPLSMREFRLRVDGGDSVDRTDWGGCGCAIE